MEGHRNHRAHLIQIHYNHAIIICHLTGIQFCVLFLTSMDFIEFFNLMIRLPDGGQAGGLSSHNINTDTEIGT